MAREDDPTQKDDPYRPDATPPGATPETRAAQVRETERREADGALHDRDAQPAGRDTLDPAARPGVVPPSHVTESPSSGAHSAVEAPRTAKGRTGLMLAVGAVILIALAFLLLGFGAEEAEAGLRLVDAATV